MSPRAKTSEATPSSLGLDPRLLDVAEQLGRVVVDRADDLRGRRRAPGDVGAVEVDELRRVAELGPLDEDVAGLEVAVHDPQVVEDLEAVGHRLHQHELRAGVERGDVGGLQADGIDLLRDLVVLRSPPEEVERDDEVAAVGRQRRERSLDALVVRLEGGAPGPLPRLRLLAPRCVVVRGTSG
jgi:hypothetical protein